MLLQLLSQTLAEHEGVDLLPSANLPHRLLPLATQLEDGLLLGLLHRLESPGNLVLEGAQTCTSSALQVQILFLVAEN